jgi:hypothetical protein
MKRFRPGQVVTWGLGRVACVVLEVRDQGLVVEDRGERLLVLYDGNARRTAVTRGGLRVLRAEGSLRLSALVPGPLSEGAPLDADALAWIERGR